MQVKSHQSGIICTPEDDCLFKVQVERHNKPEVILTETITEVATSDECNSEIHKSCAAAPCFRLSSN